MHKKIFAYQSKNIELEKQSYSILCISYVFKCAIYSCETYVLVVILNVIIYSIITKMLLGEKQVKYRLYRIRISELYTIIVIISYIITMRFDLFFKSTEEISLNMQRSVVALIGVILFASTLFTTGNKKSKRYLMRVQKYMVIFLTVIIIEILYSEFKYNYSIKNLLNISVPYMYILYVVPIIYIFSKDKSPCNLIEIISRLQLVLLIIKTIAWFTYNYSEHPIFMNFATEFSGWTRDGVQRVGIGPLFPIAFIYYSAKLIVEKKREYIPIIVFLIGFLLLVNQSRTQFITAVAVLFFIFYLTRRKSQSKVIIILIIIGLILICVFNNYISVFFNTFSKSGLYGYSTIGRLESINNFWRLFKKGYFLGLGLLENYAETAHLFYRNVWEAFYLSDIGILAGVFKFSILSIPIYFVFFYRWYKLMIKSTNNRNSDSAFVIGFGVYVILGGMMNDFFTANIAMQFPIYLALLGWYEIELEDNNVGVINI